MPHSLPAWLTIAHPTRATPAARKARRRRFAAGSVDPAVAVKVAYRTADREETFEAGDAYYVPPGLELVELHALEVGQFQGGARIGQADVRIFADVHMTVLELRREGTEIEWSQTY